MYNSNVSKQEAQIIEPLVINWTQSVTLGLLRPKGSRWTDLAVSQWPGCFIGCSVRWAMLRHKGCDALKLRWCSLAQRGLNLLCAALPALYLSLHGTRLRSSSAGGRLLDQQVSSEHLLVGGRVAVSLLHRQHVQGSFAPHRPWMCDVLAEEHRGHCCFFCSCKQARQLSGLAPGSWSIGQSGGDQLHVF